MARLTLITGGSRSGKSSYAQKLAAALPGGRGFVATAPVLNDEMRVRIGLHQQARQLQLWHTIEEQTDLFGVVANNPQFQVLLVDCLTLWVNNLLYANPLITERDVATHCTALIQACADFSGEIIFVTHEVGMGIVPENKESRLFRDLAGRCNQLMAEACDQVVFMVSGQPLKLK